MLCLFLILSDYKQAYITHSQKQPLRITCFSILEEKTLKKFDAIFQSNSYISHSQKQPPRILYLNSHTDLNHLTEFF